MFSSEIVLITLYLLVPIAIIAFFVTSLVMYLVAKKKNKLAPDTYTNSQINVRFALLLVSSLLLVGFVITVAVLVALLYMAIAYM